MIEPRGPGVQGHNGGCNINGIASCGFHLYRGELRIEVEESRVVVGGWAVRLRNDDCSIQLDVLMSDDQLDALRVAIGQAQQAQSEVVVRIAE